MEYQTTNGRILRAAGPEDADHTVLLLPGGMCTAAFFDDLLAQPAIERGRVRLLATTVPGFGGVPRPAGFDASVEASSGFAADLARELGCDSVLGHSVGANIAIEMVAAGLFDGPLFLLAPSFSLEDEMKAPRVINRVGSIPGVGRLAWAAMFKAVPKMLDGEVPAHRIEALGREMRSNDVADVRLHLRRYIEYMKRRGSVVGPLCQSGVRAEVVFGQDDEVGITPSERAVLEACPSTTLHTVPDVGHMVMNQRPEWVAELITGVLSERPAYA